MGFADSGLTIISNNMRLKDRRNRIFLKNKDVKMNYPNTALASEEHQAILEWENEVYMKRKLQAKHVQLVFTRVAIIVACALLVLGTFQLVVLFNL